MRNNIILISAVFFSGLLYVNSQIQVSKYIQHSKIATQDENALYFIDFWATWCGPCIHASKYIESLQKQYPNNFYVLSLSKESPDIVEKFNTKHKNGLATAIDHEGSTFAKHNISALPYSVLYNAKGEVLWSGNPTDFKPRHIEKFLRKNKEKISISSMIEVQNYTNILIDNTENSFKKDIHVEPLEENLYETLQVIKHNDYLELTGSLKRILAYAYNVYEKQIVIPQSINKSYTIRIKYNTNSYKNKPKYISQILKLKKAIKKEKGDGLFLDISSSTFWDTKQIDWGMDTQNFLVGDSFIKGDDVTLKEISYQLANALEMPVAFSESELENTLHDWDIHYKYFDLMTSALEDTYGIKAEKRIIEYPIYHIKSR